MQRALEALSTPGVQVFLHLLPSVCTNAAFTDIGPLSGKALQSCSVSIVIFAIQVIFLSQLLLSGSNTQLQERIMHGMCSSYSPIHILYLK